MHRRRNPNSYRNDNDESPGIRPVNLNPAYATFLLSNFSFILRPPQMSPSGIMEDYTPMMTQPEYIPPWNAVHTVMCRLSNESMACAICLEPHVAPKVTPCGHAYCSVCIHRCIRKAQKQGATGTPSPAPSCPMCSYKGITEKSLRPAIVVPTKDISKGRTVDFVLLQRNRGSIMCYTVEHFQVKHILHKSNAPQSQYTRFSLLDGATSSSLLTYYAHNVRSKIDEETRYEPTPESAAEYREVAEFVIQDLTNLAEDAERSDAMFPLEFNIPPSADHVMMYQAKDGQQAFLDPLNVRMLYYDAVESDEDPRANMQYPQGMALHVTCPILSTEVIVQNEATRKRYKVFSHIPVKSSFILCFADLSGVVSSNTMRVFADVVKDRIQRIRAQERSEEQRSQAQTKKFEKSWLERERQISELWNGPQANEYEFVDMDSEFPELDPSPLPPPVVTSDTINTSTTASPQTAWKVPTTVKATPVARSTAISSPATPPAWRLVVGKDNTPGGSRHKKPTSDGDEDADEDGGVSAAVCVGRAIDGLFSTEEAKQLSSSSSASGKKKGGRKGGKTVSLTNGGL